MSKYVDGFLLAIPKENLETYKEMATEASQIWKKYGALDYKECLGNDLNPQGIEFPFTKAIQAKENEVIIFAYILYKSKEHRDQVNAQVMKDPLMSKYENQPMPFEMNRMAFGGFEVIVEA